MHTPEHLFVVPLVVLVAAGAVLFGQNARSAERTNAAVAQLAAVAAGRETPLSPWGGAWERRSEGEAVLVRLAAVPREACARLATKPVAWQGLVGTPSVNGRAVPPRAEPARAVAACDGATDNALEWRFAARTGPEAAPRGAATGGPAAAPGGGHDHEK